MAAEFTPKKNGGLFGRRWMLITRSRRSVSVTRSAVFRNANWRLKTVGNRNEQYAGLPVRAIGDKRLSATHFRVLAAVAYHDRFSTSRHGGQGCWAKNETLAKLCGVNVTNLSTAINELGGWGYLVRKQQPNNKRQRVLLVVYEDLPMGKASDAESFAHNDGSFAPEAKPAFARSDSEVEQNQRGYGSQYSHEYTPQKRRIDLVETYPLTGANRGRTQRLSSVGSIDQIQDGTDAVASFDAYMAAIESIGA